MNRRLGVAYIVAAQALAGTTYTMTAKALQGLTPLILVFQTSLVAGLLLLPIAIARRPTSRSQWLRLMAAGIFGYGAAVILSSEGVKLCGPATSGLLTGLQPVALLLFSMILLKETVDGRKAAAVLLGVGGAVVLLRLEKLMTVSFWNAHSLGILFLILAAAFGAIRSLIARMTVSEVSPMAFTALTTLLATGPIAAAAWPQMSVSGFLRPLGSWEAVVYLAVVGTIGCRVLGCRALLYMTASDTAPYFFLQPLVGTLMGAAWESRWLTSREMTGGGLILVGAALALAPALKGRT